MWKEFVPVDIIKSLSIDLLRYLLHILKISPSKTDSAKYQKVRSKIYSFYNIYYLHLVYCYCLDT